MNKAELFQDLVGNAVIPGFNYSSQSFSFETIFYVCGHSYCCCSCAFDHEYMTYIADNGEIDTKVLETIIKCISEEKCPHVNDALTEYVTMTKVNGMHIAAAKGFIEAMPPNATVQIQQTNASSGLFGITPYHMAFLKCHPELLKPLRDAYTPSPLDQFMLYCSRKTDMYKCIEIKNISLVESCARKNNIELFEHFCEIHSLNLGVSDALEYIFKHKLNNMEAILHRNLDKCLIQEDFECLELALIYDKPELLYGFLKYVSRSSFFEKQKQGLYALGLKLKRDRCIEILSKYGSAERTVAEDDAATIEYLLEILLKYPDQLRDHLIPLLKTFTETVNILKGEESKDRHVLKFIQDNFLQLDVKQLEALFALEYEVGSLCKSDPTVLHHILNQQVEPNRLPAIQYRSLRKLIELSLNHNLGFQAEHNSMELCNSIISLAASIDVKINSITRTHLIEVDYLIMDGTIHSFVGQKDDYLYALNFIVPLLIEYGITVNRKMLESIQLASLHPLEQEYLQFCARNPRSLMKICRDMLRQVFKGEQIREFLGVSNLPKEVKDFILLERDYIL